MLDANTFKTEILDPVVDDFRKHPASLHKGFCTIWSLDAYASHCAFQSKDFEKLTRCERGQIENKFKNALVDSEYNEAWRFRLVREASNATKHAVRRHTNTDIPNSRGVNSANIDGAAWYFSGASYWGDQIVIEVEWTFDEERNVWVDGKGDDVKPGPFFSSIPLLDLIDPCIRHIERGV